MLESVADVQDLKNMRKNGTHNMGDVDCGGEKGRIGHSEQNLKIIVFYILNNNNLQTQVESMNQYILNYVIKYRRFMINNTTQGFQTIKAIR